MDKVISSPLIYWGGKRWLFKKVWELIPEGETEIFSPFLGGGPIEINLAYRGYTVHAYDNCQPLVNFWQHWLDDPESVRLAVYELLSLYSHSELMLLRLQKKYLKGFNLYGASCYYLFSRLAHSGLARKCNDKYLHNYYCDESGEYMRGIPEKYQTRVFPNWGFWQSNPISNLNIQHADFESVFWIHNHEFAYVDPPYFDNEWTYRGSENGFNHELLRELLGQRGKWILSYNDHPKTYELYDGYHIQPIKRGSDGRTELLILSPDITQKQLTLF